MKKSFVVAMLLCISLSTSKTALALEPGDTPWIGWGEVSSANTQSDREQGVKFDGYFKQGYVVSNFGDGWSLVPYAALGVKVSENSDERWNNRAEPWVGFEAKKPMDFGNGKWGELSIGVRAGRYTYFGGGHDDSIVMVYANFSAGGPNW